MNNFNISDFGAIGDGKTMNTTAIQSAIDECSKQGGGTVVLKSGVYLSGSITLKSGKTLLTGKKVTIRVNGVTFTGTTNSKGVASVKVSLSKKGTYTATAKFDGDANTKATSVKFKVKIS